ncbi:glycosyltransferase family 4 protein [Telluria sp. B2]
MKISYVNGICLNNDAISNSIRDEVIWLSEAHDVRLYTYACDNPALPARIVTDVRDIVFDPHFQSSDLVVFHFGVFYPLFDLLPVVPRNALRMVVFHNITPRQFVASADHSLIDKSFVQMSNMTFADHVVCVSQVNLDVLRQAGVHVPATVLPLALHARPALPEAKPSFEDGILRFVFVGRFVRSKGPAELLEALTQVLEARPALRAQLDLIGNLRFSDQTVLAEMNTLIECLHTQFGARVQVNLHGSAPEQLKTDCLAQADIFVLPSYHEGFCVPILEALASGCRVIAYDNSNIPHISGGLATLVPSGDKHQLATAMGEVADTCAASAWRAGDSDSYATFAGRAAAYVAQFNPHSTKQRFLRLIGRLMPAIPRSR